jgi:hypothetical protein
MRIIPIVPSKKPIPNNLTVSRAIQEGLNRAADALKEDFQKTVSTWNDKPTFLINKYGSPRMSRVVSAKNKIYFFVSEGTRVRYATMTPNFIAKTAPGRFQAQAGAGGVAYISKKHPRPGIKARKFDEQLMKRWQDKLPTYMKLEIK